MKTSKNINTLKRSNIVKENKNRYEIFVRVAEIGNISRASELLNYTQSGISHVIAALEQELGIQLFIRSKSGVSLTEKGNRIIPYVRALLQKENALRQAAYEMNHTIAGTLRIGSFSSASAFWMPGIVKYFRARYPEVDIEISDGNYNEIRDWIKKGQVDCGFLSSIVADGFHFVPLLKDPLYVVVAKSHPLAKKKSVELKEALRYPLILETPGCDSDIQLLLESSPVTPSVSYSFRDDSILFSFVEQNLGITISQDLVLKAFGKDVVFIPLSPERHRIIGLAFADTMNTLLSNVFLEYMQSMQKGNCS